MRTQLALVNAALQFVGAFGQGQTVSADDKSTTLLVMHGAAAELMNRGVVSLILGQTDTAEEIPEEIFQLLARLIALDVGPAFGMPVPDNNERERIISSMRRIYARGPTYRPAEATYF